MSPVAHVFLRGKPLRNAITCVVHSPWGYQAIRNHLKNGPHFVITPHHMLETPAASMKLPKDLKEKFIDAYSERYLELCIAMVTWEDRT